MPNLLPATSDTTAGYELIDFGRGRKLERFGGVIVDRPCPAAALPRRSEKEWSSAELMFDTPARSQVRPSHWIFRGQTMSDPDQIPAWDCHHRGLIFRIRPQSSGQVGVFPEHWDVWDWMAERLGREPRNVLNLFAYTGATSLALAALGMNVTHVDAVETTVAWARENASQSGLENAPIRWIVDDARAYVTRELRRGNRYDLVLLDPPSYGHGAKGQAWSIQRDLIPLVTDCWRLLSESPVGVLLAGHSPAIDLGTVHRGLEDNAKSGDWISMETGQAKLIDRANRPLDCGYVARFVPLRVGP